MHQELSAERPAYEEQQHKVGGGYHASSARIIVTTIEVGDSPRSITVHDREQMPRSIV